jgi:hypothetical protein
MDLGDLANAASDTFASREQAGEAAGRPNPRIGEVGNAGWTPYDAALA